MSASSFRLLIARIKSVRLNFYSCIFCIFAVLLLLPVLVIFVYISTGSSDIDALAWLFFIVICIGLLMLFSFVSMALTLISWIKKHDRKISEYIFLLSLIVFLTPAALFYGLLYFDEQKRIAHENEYYENLNLDQKLAFQLQRWGQDYASVPYGKEKDIQRLIREGANIDAPNGQGLTPLCRAVVQGYRKGLLQFILDNGADRNQLCAKGQSVVHTAAKYCIAPSLQVLAANKLDLTSLTDDHKSPFDLILTAAERNPYNCIQTALILKEYGVDISQQDSDGNTILHLVAAGTSKHNLQLLIEAGVNPKIKNTQGLTAGMVAKAYYQKYHYSLDHPVLQYLEEQENPHQE